MSSIKMLLVAIATANYLSEAKQLFASAHDAGYWQGDYMLLTQGISAEDHLWYENRGILVREYEPVISEEEWSQSPSSTIYNKIVMERFHLFKEEFKQWNVVVYMDCDIIVTGPLIRLEQIKGFAATVDSCMFLRINILPSFWNNITTDGYSLNSMPFNAGVFAFNTNIITQNTFADMLSLARRYLHLTAYSDQCFLNLFFYKKWQKLSMAYGYMITREYSAFLQQPKDALVLHFTSINRPWELTSPYHQLWIDNLNNAEHIDFPTPKQVDKTVLRRAFIKETFFIPWRFYLMSYMHYINLGTIIKLLDIKFSHKGWYLYLKSIKENILNKESTKK